jgi:anti-anti-sigma factor
MINVAVEGTISVVTVEGDHLDSSNYKQFKAEIQPYLREGMNIVLDIGTLKFIDSSGLGVFLSVLRDLQNRKGVLRICRPTPAVKILFELVRLEKIIDIFPARDEAVKSVQ